MGIHVSRAGVPFVISTSSGILTSILSCVMKSPSSCLKARNSLDFWISSKTSEGFSEMSFSSFSSMRRLSNSLNPSSLSGKDLVLNLTYSKLWSLRTALISLLIQEISLEIFLISSKVKLTFVVSSTWFLGLFIGVVIFCR